MRRLAGLLATLALALVAAPAAMSGAEVDAGTFSLPIDTFLPCGVGGETIELTGSADYHFVFLSEPGGGAHIIYGAQEALSGVGLTTGMTYKSRSTFTDSLQITGGAAQVFHFVTNARLVGPGGQIIHFFRSIEVVVDGNVVRDTHVQIFCA